MAPKKADAAKAAKLSEKENLARAETEILSLQHLLELRSHEVRSYHQKEVGYCGGKHASPTKLQGTLDRP